MNKRYCYGTDCDEDRCTCHDDDVDYTTAGQDIRNQIVAKNSMDQAIAFDKALVKEFKCIYSAEHQMLNAGDVIRVANELHLYV